MTHTIHGELRETVPIAAQRFERSPFHDCWATPDTVLGVYAGRFYPVTLGSPPEEGYRALRERACLYDVPERPVEISGPDAVALLERVIARDVASLKPGRGRYGIMLTPSGGLLMDGILFRLEESRFWFVQPDGPLDEWLDAHSGGLDVTVSDPRSWVLQLQGPASQRIMGAATGGATDALKYFHAGFFEIGGQRVYVSRTGWTAELGYEVYTLGDDTDAPRLWADLIAAGEPHGMAVDGLGSMEIRRIEGGILNARTDFDRATNPWQAGLGPFVDLDRRGYTGREALDGLDRGLLIHGIEAEGGPPVGAVLCDGERVGRVTASAVSPTLGRGIGYVRFERPGEWGEAALTLEDGRECHVRPLPFLDPEKRLPRGLPLEG